MYWNDIYDAGLVGSSPEHAPTLLYVMFFLCKRVCCILSSSFSGCLLFQWKPEGQRSMTAMQLSILVPAPPPPPPLPPPSLSPPPANHLCFSLPILLNTVILLLLHLLLSLSFSLSLDSSSLSSLPLYRPSPFVWDTGPRGRKAAVKQVWWIQYVLMKVLDQNLNNVTETHH